MPAGLNDLYRKGKVVIDAAQNKYKEYKAKELHQKQRRIVEAGSHKPSMKNTRKDIMKELDVD